MAVALEIGQGTPASGGKQLELRFPRGSARASTARIGPIRAGRGRPSGVQDCHFAAGRRTTPVLDAGTRLVRPVLQEVLETLVEGPRKTWAQGPLCVRRDRGPTPSSSLSFSGCSVGGLVEPSGGARSHVLVSLRANPGGDSLSVCALDGPGDRDQEPGPLSRPPQVQVPMAEAAQVSRGSPRPHPPWPPSPPPWLEPRWRQGLYWGSSSFPFGSP